MMLEMLIEYLKTKQVIPPYILERNLLKKQTIKSEIYQYLLMTMDVLAFSDTICANTRRV